MTVVWLKTIAQVIAAFFPSGTRRYQGNQYSHIGRRLVWLLLCGRVATSFAQTPLSQTIWSLDAVPGNPAFVTTSVLVNTPAGQKLWLGGNFNSIGRTTGRAAWFDSASGTGNFHFPIVNAAQILAAAQYGQQWIVAGESGSTDASGNQLGFVELINADGSVDSSFQATTDGPGFGTIRAVAVAGNNKIVIAGAFTTASLPIP